ncbi:dTDP-4-dehydrorhamnose 3,5-epimerase [bacterium]|nr:dTDP-4-dehydrorhamnose 3,5-epimerase [bacterium]
MQLIETTHPDVKLIDPVVFGDHRGFFMECFHIEKYRELGIEQTFIQSNLAMSRKHVLRGLHYQEPYPQGKLINVIIGEVYDVAVDIRRSSPTFKQWIGVHLSEERKQLMYIPPGFAHGYLVLSDVAYFTYQTTDVYHPEADRGIRWDDPDIGIEWPVDEPILSEKDQATSFLKDALLPER